MSVTWSDRDSDYSKEDEANFIAFASKSNNVGVVETGGSFGVASGVSGGVQTLEYESSDDAI